MVNSTYPVNDGEPRARILRDELKALADETCVTFAQTMVKYHTD